MGLLKTLRRSLIDRPFWIDHDAYLDDVRGVIHVGANLGQERKIYAKRDLPVVWIEPIPEVFEQLERNIAPYPKQRALRALITERPGERHELNVASNKGGSSSILPLERHTDMWPEVRYERKIALESDSLPSLLQRHGLLIADYDFLTLDTQGSELLVLRGAEPLLPRFRYIKTEVADFELYAGGVQLPELSAFLAAHGFVEHSRYRFATRPDIGSCYDIVYRRDG